MRSSEGNNQDRNPVARALEVLAWMIESSGDDVGVRELATSLGISPSTAHRLLAQLGEAGLVSRDPDSARYSLGIEMLRLAHLAAARMPLRRAALRHMRRLVDSCNETALLGIYDPARQQMMFALSVDSTHTLRYAVELNSWVPVHAGASGLAILAFLEEAEIRAVIERGNLASLTERTLTIPYRLDAEITRVRERGYAITHGQRIQGAVGLAVPVFGSRGAVIGDVCLTIPEQRYEPDGEARLAAELMECAARITGDLGGHLPRPNGRDTGTENLAARLGSS